MRSYQFPGRHGSGGDPSFPWLCGNSPESLTSWAAQSCSLWCVDRVPFPTLPHHPSSRMKYTHTHRNQEANATDTHGSHVSLEFKEHILYIALLHIVRVYISTKNMQKHLCELWSVLTIVFSLPSASLRFLCACFTAPLSTSTSLYTKLKSSTRIHGPELNAFTPAKHKHMIWSHWKHNGDAHPEEQESNE